MVIRLSTPTFIMELPTSLKTSLLKNDCSIVFLYVQWCGMSNSMPLIYVFMVWCSVCPAMIFFSNCGVQVCKPKSLYTLSHKVVLGSMTGFCHCHMLLLLLFIKRPNFLSNSNIHLFSFLKLYQCNTTYPVDPFNMFSPD